MSHTMHTHHTARSASGRGATHHTMHTHHTRLSHHTTSAASLHTARSATASVSAAIFALFTLLILPAHAGDTFIGDLGAKADVTEIVSDPDTGRSYILVDGTKIVMLQGGVKVAELTGLKNVVALAARGNDFYFATPTHIEHASVAGTGFARTNRRITRNNDLFLFSSIAVDQSGRVWGGNLYH